MENRRLHGRTNKGWKWKEKRTVDEWKDGMEAKREQQLLERRDQRIEDGRTKFGNAQRLVDGRVWKLSGMSGKWLSDQLKENESCYERQNKEQRKKEQRLVIESKWWTEDDKKWMIEPDIDEEQLRIASGRKMATLMKEETKNRGWKDKNKYCRKTDR